MWQHQRVCVVFSAITDLKLMNCVDTNDYSFSNELYFGYRLAKGPIAYGGKTSMKDNFVQF
jgi:hypothetical protein